MFIFRATSGLHNMKITQEFTYNRGYMVIVFCERKKIVSLLIRQLDQWTNTYRKTDRQADRQAGR